MNATQKRQFISELVEAFWPAVVVARLWDIDDRSFLYIDFVRSDEGHEAEDAAGIAMRHRIIARLFSELGESASEEFILSYDFDSGLGMTLCGRGKDSEVSDRLLDLILDEIPESYIRETFKLFQLNFFEHMESSPEEWHMRPIPTIE